MGTIWVIVADSQRARIFETSSPIAPLQEIEDLVHPPSRLPSRELVSDRPGRGFGSFTDSRHAMDPPTPPKRREAMVFARSVADFLAKAQTGQRFEALVLCAEPTMLGLLRRELPARVSAVVRHELAKNLAHLVRADEIRAHLPERL